MSIISLLLQQFGYGHKFVTRLLPVFNDQRQRFYLEVRPGLRNTRPYPRAVYNVVIFSGFTVFNFFGLERTTRFPKIPGNALAVNNKKTSPFRERKGDVNPIS